MRWAILITWLAVTTVQTHAYAKVWQSDLTLWAHASRVAPFKPRPALNYAVSLIGQRDVNGLAMLERAGQLAHLSHVPWYDRDMTVQAVRRNLGALR